MARPRDASAFVLAALFLSLPAATAAQQAAAGDLVLQTQYDSAVAFAGLRGDVVALVYADREGSGHTSPYVRAARDRWEAGGDGPRLLQAADLRGVPGVLKGYARGRFRQPTSSGARRTAVLLDWRGDIAARFGAQPKLANVYVLDADGRLVWSASGTGSAEEVASFMTAVGEVLERRTR
jgi:hypothetical protein